ncbi:hypothetical protein P154DRAFT_446367 [Amniculicola lignicola CBS 123094]|uniref:E3 ubiquitin-protein ligase listerin n=1 Tax=Amniculicola lignicola CBS 123094 TaxID=1392246 RepID=A0A6A5W4J5_9PLEO|nr:hypothetical protein P154DRAFT_446367 [Amniculicola lignicola CBS 123094]
MSKRQGKAQASSARASSSFGTAFGASAAPAFGVSSSQLSYVTEPPDLSAISEPTVVVYFRNLSKRDSTTKAKALEDIQSYILSLQEPVEEGVLEAWIKMFPRSSIDNAKAVRQNAHILQGQIAASAGKRIAKHMPKCVAAWLCGLYDSDRSVVDATQSSLRQVFNTPEKIQAIRKAYQQPILEYSRNAIDKETALTLSDERTVGPDDAEAKYSRVISSCISLVGSLLANLKAEELSKFQSDYEALLADTKLWSFASYTDPIIRRALHRLLKTCLDKQPELLQHNLGVLSKSYLSIALNSDQTGSAFDYVDALAILTTKYPTVWTDHYQSKTAVEKRLRQFLKRGSQFGPRDFWSRLLDMFSALPQSSLPANAANAKELMNALHSGIIRKDESRFNLEAAWTTYLRIADRICNTLVDEDQRILTTETIQPLISQYLRPTSENSEWTLPAGSISTKLILSSLGVGKAALVLEQEWPRHVKSFTDDIKTSSPEQSKDYGKSQDALKQQAARFASLQDRILNEKFTASLRSTATEGCNSIILEALAVLKNRNGKPYGAAAAVTEILQRNKPLISSISVTNEALESFIKDDLPGLSTWSACLKAALAAEESPAKSTALEALLTSSKIPSSFDLASTDSELQRYIKSSVNSALAGSLEWEAFDRMLQSPSNILAPATTDEILSTLTQALTLPVQAPTALQGFRHIVKHNPILLKTFVSTPDGSGLLQTLLLATESPSEEISQEAATINASIRTLLSAESDSKQTIFGIIHQGLVDATATSVSIETLVDLAKQLIKSGADWDEAKEVFPRLDDWNAALAPFLSLAPRSSLAITNPLGGAVYLAQHNTSREQIRQLSRDADGYSPAFRMAQYTIKLFKEVNHLRIGKIPFHLENAFLRNIALTFQLADDNLGLASANDLWAVYNLEVEADAMAFMSDAHVFIENALTLYTSQWSDPSSEASLLTWANDLLSQVKPGTTPEAYHTSRAYSVLISDLIDVQGWNASYTAAIQDSLKTLRRSKEIFSLVGFLNAFKDPLAASKSCERFCSELVADLTGLEIDNKLEEALRQLILLNTLLDGQEDVVQTIAKQRVIFFVKHVLSWLQDKDASLPLRAETCRALTVVIPIMKDIYGEHWGQLLTALFDSWLAITELEMNESGSDSPVPYVHASLKLFQTLFSMTLGGEEDSNDDLVEAIEGSEKDRANGLINLLKHSQHFPDEFHQPLKIVNEILGRQIQKVSHKHLEETEELYPLLYVESQAVQLTAFNLLHKQIPEAQEQISIDAALEKVTARLPEELLSLILEPPTMAALAGATFERTVPISLRGYLFSWLLIFDHLEHASFKVKNDYVENIKEGDYLPGLLDFAFDFLGHSHNKPVDLKALTVTEYEPNSSPPKADVQWLLAHLYYLCLRHIPSLTKTWWKDCKSRPIVVTLEPWTKKYISPPVIAAALKSVSDWADAQSEQGPTSTFTVRVSRAGEITASYVIDEQTMSMRITLPPAFPLANAHIEGLARVAVNEQKWQSWLRTSLGAITIFNGSLIDALGVWRRNVEGVLKGQTECAICYSIVGSDRKLPDKRCSTCRNAFHGGCLFKWFKSSGSSSCPLCRNPFNYG